VIQGFGDPMDKIVNFWPQTYTQWRWFACWWLHQVLSVQVSRNIHRVVGFNGSVWHNCLGFSSQIRFLHSHLKQDRYSH